MNYRGVRDIVRDVLESERSYSDRTKELREKRLHDLEDIVYQLASFLNVTIERDRGARVVLNSPESTQSPDSALSVAFAPPVDR